ncbi:MAG TPA: single-stranded-DNA-specific exonuclease RecJ [Anaerolineaceae bacterium]|nr:single-stranded-DNA-specific exonuclease RecJ [Anaerolineaceae bacterium]HQF44423.1 single-stranded-DNA-specific exonuclease RecJ [Anaerolineaceae bacterium]HQH34310.1 single-stranded-DNA-specific exonuclease RecJ [Anaerolineaceae bacterium]HQJ02447.1 single-stranded-DNA-specific exonuclease RecJ [Anaerolineaceae bacterium]
MQIPAYRRWQIAPALPAEANIALVEYPYPIRQILYNRGCLDADSAERYLRAQPEMYDPFQMIGMEDAVARILSAISMGEEIVVYGDYDVDGVTATALLVQVLQQMGGKARAYIPNRFDEGYGLNNEALDVLAQEQVRLVITVDCGIRSPVEAEHARSCGMDMIITDHHHPKDEIPNAWAVICPRQEGDPYPDKNLAGVGLAFKLAQALLLRHPVEGVSAEDWLDLVALGTVADLVPLVDENRGLVRAGLRILRMGRRQGVLSLAQAAGLNPERLTAGDISFGLAPRLNAAGRLESALAAFAMLMSTDPMEAGPLAQKLDDQNRQRQKITQEIQQAAELMAAEEVSPHLIFAVHPEFNSGVVGLAASRLVEAYYRPAIVGQIGEETTRASCRSIPIFHITKALDECADLLVRHGGHAMAAGFTVSNHQLEELRVRLQAIAERELADQELVPSLRADIELPLSEIRPSLLPYLDQLQPTGTNNPEAVFVARNLWVTNSRTVGAEKKHLKLTVTDGSITYDAIAFRQGHWQDQMPESVDLMFTFEKNNFQGREYLQLNVKDIQPSP